MTQATRLGVDPRRRHSSSVRRHALVPRDAVRRHGDVVVVTINYRLGAFGFLHLADAFGPEFEGSGNAGILDQVAALAWVRDSIAAFGGDPANVTVFGESAGGGSVGTLLGLPAARGLFQKAIAESGASSWWATRESAAGIAEKVIAQLGVAPGERRGAARDPDGTTHRSRDESRHRVTQ
jgi:para-nitrobenzyl esterase